MPPSPSDSIDRERIEADWRSRGFSCDLWIDPPGQIWEDFVHSTDEVVVVVEGELEIEVGGEVLRPAPGEEVFIPRGTSHTVRNIGGATARWLYGYN